MKENCPCFGCEDRVADPNCHSLCDKWKSWRSAKDVEDEKRRKAKNEYDDITGYQIFTNKKIRKIKAWSDKR